MNDFEEGVQLVDALMIERQSGSQIKTRMIRLQPVVREIVDPAEAQRGAKMISLGSMIVNYVQNHFDTRHVKIAHHRFELDDLFAELPAARVLRMRRKKSDRVVPPVIRQTAINQNFIV